MKIKILMCFIILNIYGCSHNIYDNNNQSKTYSISSSLSDVDKNEIILLSLNLLDTKYNWGGKKPDFGLDCSGFVSFVFYKSVQIKLLGAAKDIAKNGDFVPLSFASNGQLELGDLLFFNTTGTPYSHVGIYIGNNSFIHASSKSKKVTKSNILNSYYFSKLEEIRRI